MVLTEEEKKEYLINYKPQSMSHVKLAVFFGAVFATWLVLTMLSDLGYINLDFSSNLTILYAGVVGFVCGYIVKYAMCKVKK